MADGYISQIKTPDNKVYLLKDSESVRRDSELLTTNPFAPASLRGPYISKIDNAFYAADKRWQITATNLSYGGVEALFDGNYETQARISGTDAAVITMDFDPEHTNVAEKNKYFPGYPYGYILISFYSPAGPASISGRVYCNYSAQGIGWHDLTFSPISDNTTYNIVYRSEHQGYYNMAVLEITINGNTSNSYGYTSITQIEMHLDRPSSNRTPFLSKYGDETLYYNLTAPKFIGALQGNADTATKFSSTRKIELTGAITGSATTDGSSGWTISTTVNHNHDSIYSYIHLTDYDFTDTRPLSKYVTFDKSKPVGAPREEWYNGFISSHSNYHASYIINGHTHQDEWYVGHGIWREADTPHAPAPTWYLLAHSGNVGTGDNNGQVKIAGVNVSVKGLAALAYKASLSYSDVGAAPAVTGGYLPLSGGQMTGPLTWKNSTALPETTSSQYFLVIDAFADGGTTKWISKANALTSLGAAASNHNHNGTYVPNTSGANDVNTIYNTGIYNITSGSLTHGPTGYGFGQLLVMSYRKHTGNTTTDWATQIYAHLGSGNNGNTLYYRTSNVSTWQTWQMVAHTDAATAMGNAKKPIYINAKGEIQEGDALKNLAYKDSLTSSDIPDNAANTTGNAATSTSANYLYPFSDGTNVSGTTNIQILTTLQANDNIPRNKPFGVLLQHGNHSVGFGYFYPKSRQYGGWYIANYSGPSYIGLNNGTWTSYTFLTNQNSAAGTNNNATLTWNTAYTIAKINGTDIKFTTMAKPSYAFIDLTEHPTTLSGYGITDANIASGVITLGSNTITPVTSVNGHTGSSVDVTAADLGLSNAMHFIGVVASSSTNTPSDGSNSVPTITGLSSYTPAAGDVVIDKDNLREYVWSNGAWILLGFTTSNIYNSDSITASSSDEPTWISNIQQATDGKISVQRQTIGTLGIGHGGTGKSEWTQWGIVYASATNTLDQVTAGASTNINQPLISGGAAAPKWYAGLTLTGNGTQESPYDATFNNTVTITGATTLSSTLSVADNSTLTGKVGIGASPDNNYQLYVNGNSQFNGNLIPTITDNNADKTLGSSDNRWAKLYIGNDDNHGDAYTPVYWNDGVPTEVTLVQQCTFTINSGKSGVRLTHAAINAKSYVTQIVVSSGESNLNSAISWQSYNGANTGDPGYIELTCSAVSGQVDGYIMISRGGEITATATDII